MKRAFVEAEQALPHAENNGRRRLVLLRNSCFQRYLRGSTNPRRARALPQTGFTVVEMMVVIAIIALILIVGVPAFNTMSVEQGFSRAHQLLNGALTRAHIVSLSERNLAAVRVFPAAWALSEEGTPAGEAGRQMLATYVYRFTYAANPADPSQVAFAERFERLEEGPMQLLPPDTWIAPSEALDVRTNVLGTSDPISDYVLHGTIGRFELDPDGVTNSGEKLLDADDFLIVFDPETGVKPSFDRRPWALKSYVPDSGELGSGADEVAGQEVAGCGWIAHKNAYRIPFQRFNFTGAVVYQREPFEALGAEGDDNYTISERREVLKRVGRTFYVDRTGGGLIAAGGEQTEE